jgi:hypothetical protein
MARKKRSRNSPCPCGSGKKYKHCVRHEVAPDEWSRDGPDECPCRFPTPACIPSNGDVRSRG